MCYSVGSKERLQHSGHVVQHPVTRLASGDTFHTHTYTATHLHTLHALHTNTYIRTVTITVAASRNTVQVLKPPQVCTGHIQLIHGVTTSFFFLTTAMRKTQECSNSLVLLSPDASTAAGTYTTGTAVSLEYTDRE